MRRYFKEVVFILQQVFGSLWPPAALIPAFLEDCLYILPMGLDKPDTGVPCPWVRAWFTAWLMNGFGSAMCSKLS